MCTRAFGNALFGASVVVLLSCAGGDVVSPGPTPVATVTVSPALPTIIVGASAQLTAITLDANGVHAMHARKMAALLQASTASDPAEQPVLLWVDRDAGHGQGKPLNLRIRDLADWRIFVMWQLGMLEKLGC